MTDNNDESGLALELEGTIYLSTVDKDGNVLSRQPLDAQIMLDALTSIVSKSLESALSEGSEEEFAKKIAETLKKEDSG